MNYSYSQIVPDALQGELIHLGETSTLISWRIGDIVHEVKEFVTANRMDVGMEEIYSAVGMFCGKKARTVREYAALSRQFVDEAREIYGVLRFDHFRLAATFDDPREVLDWAVSQVDELNRPATVDACEAHFGAQWQRMPQEALGSPETENMDAEALDAGKRTSGLPGGSSSPVMRIAAAIQQIEELRHELSLTAADTERLEQAMTTILEILMRVRS